MNISEFLNITPTVILDGAMGTELQRRGYRTELPLWSAKANLDAAEMVEQVHKDFIEAGSDIITTNTFRTIKRSFQKVGDPNKAEEATKKAVEIAKSAASSSGRKIYVAGSVTTLEDCYEPKLVPENAVLEEEHTTQVKLLSSLAVDLLLIETVNSIREAVVISKAAYESKIPFFISFVTDGKGNLLSGESIRQVLMDIKQYRPLGVLLNCRPLETLSRDISVLRSYHDGVTGVYANGCGKPDNVLGWSFEGCLNPLEEYLKYTKKWMDQGVKIIGGCCGTTPEYIKSISELAKNKK